MRNIIQFTIKNSQLIILLTVLITLFMGFNLTKVQINPDLNALMPENDRLAQMIDKYDPENQEKNLFLMALEVKGSLSKEGLQAYEQVIEKINQETGGFSSSIFSSVTFIKEGRRLVPRNLLEEKRAPRNEEEMQIFLGNMTDDIFSKEIFYSADGKKFNTLFFHPEPLEEDFISNYYNIIKELEPYFFIHTSGTVFLTERSGDFLSNDLTKLLLISLFTILVIYFLGFKSKRAVLLPVSVVLIGTIWTVGFMGIAGFEVTVISIVIPPLVLTIGTSYAIHFINQYFFDARENQDNSWLIETSIHINKTILFAAATTLVGFLSLLFTSMEATRHFGLSTSVGIVSCAILSLTYLPASLSRMKVPKLFQRKTVQKGFLTKLSGKSSLGVYKYRYPILLLFVIITVLFSLTYTSIKSQSDYTTYFPDEEPLVQDLKYIMKNFAGVQRLNLTITAPESSKNYFLNPDNLKAITELEQVIERKEDVLKVMSFPGIIEDLNLLMSGQKEIPQSRGLVLLLSRYTKALSGSMESGLSNILINEDHSRINLTIMIRNSESHTFLSEEGLRELIYSIEIEAHKHLETELYFDIWGFDMEYLDLAEAVARDQRLSTILSIGVILLMTTILFRSLTMGLMTLIPLFSGLMLNSLFMILFQIPLDITTMMVSSVAIGVGVDDAVHYMLQFRQQRKLFSSPQKIFYNCATISGRPIILTTISIVGGLISLTLASFKGIVYFGALVSITLASTMIGTLILLPALLAILMDMKNSVLPAAKFSRR